MTYLHTYLLTYILTKRVIESAKQIKNSLPSLKSGPDYMKPDLFGMKYPASRMMGGSMKRKNRFGVSVEGGCSEVKNRRKPKNTKKITLISCRVGVKKNKGVGVPNE